MNAAPIKESENRASILLVDDYPANLKALMAMLEGEDYCFVCATSGEAALREVLRQDFAVILMDVAMPGMDGIETARLIKQRKRASHVPIVFVTAHMRDVETIAKSYAAGGVDYLMKPLVVDAVRAKVAGFVALFRERQRVERWGKRVQEELQAVAQASMIVAEAVAGIPEASVLAVLKTVALQAQAMTGAEFTAVGVGTDPERTFDLWEFVGIRPEVVRAIGRHPRPVGLLGFVARGNVVVRLKDLHQHEVFRGFPPNHPNMSSFLGVPIRFRGKGVGTLYLANKRGAEEFTEHDADLITMLAGRAGVAIETARLYQAEGMERVWLETVIDQMPEGVLVVDPQGRITVKNRWMLALSPAETGESDSFGNRVDFDAWLPSGERVPAPSLPHVRALWYNEAIVGQELLMRRKNGDFVPVLASAAPIHTRTGEVAGATMTVRDISQLREAENRRKEWTSIVAHDLRQPVNIIIMAADELQRDSLPANAPTYLQRISVSARHLNRMIDDLLDVACIESRQVTLRRSEVELVALVHAVIDRMGAAAPRCEVSAAPGEHGVVWADPARVEQVLSNLLSNAAKYGDPSAPVEIVVRSSGGEAEVVVTNVGQIPARELPRLFQRFARTVEARAGRAGGLGLGLYICKGLVEAHGGRIWVESTSGKVSFHFTLPLFRPSSA